MKKAIFLVIMMIFSTILIGLPSVNATETIKFDFGTSTSPVESGYIRVTESTIYSPALGYGWADPFGPPIHLSDLNSRDRGAPDTLKRDFVFSNSPNTFKVDLDEWDEWNDYTVKVLIGDNGYNHDNIGIIVGYGNDEMRFPGVASVSVPAGSFKVLDFCVSPTFSALFIHFEDNGGSDANWVVNAIEVSNAPRDYPTAILNMGNGPGSSLPGQSLDGHFYYNYDYVGLSGFMFFADEIGQRGVQDLGDIGSISLGDVTVPSSGYIRSGVAAIRGHTYVALAKEGEEGNYIVFRVFSFSDFGDVFIEYFYRSASTFKFMFDFGTAASPVETGYTRVTHTTLYSPSLGYGWYSTSGLNSRDRGAPDNLKRDFVFGSGGIFLVDLPYGPYWHVSLTIGDNNYRHDNIDVFHEGYPTGIDDLTVNAGEFATEWFSVEVVSSQLLIEIFDDGGSDPNFVLNAMEIELEGIPGPIATSATLNISPNPVVIASPVLIIADITPDPPTGYFYEGCTFTVTRPDGMTETIGPLISDPTGIVAISYTPSMIGTYEVEFSVPEQMIVDTVYLAYTIDVTFSSTEEPPPPADSYKFDFGTATSPVESGYTRVTHTTSYSPVLHYGWTSTSNLDSRDRGAPTNLKRDFVFSSSTREFKIDLPTGTYTVEAIMGDNNYLHDYIDIYAEGALKANVGIIYSGDFVVRTFSVTVSDGQLNLVFDDVTGSDQNWIVNAIEITEGTTPPAFWMGYDFGTATSPLLVDYVPSPCIRVTDTTLYSVASGYGWTIIAGLDSRHRPTPVSPSSAGHVDFVFSNTNHEFKIDLVNGVYTVVVHVYDEYYLHDLIDVFAEGALKLDNLSNDVSAGTSGSFSVVISDGQLNLVFRDDGGSDSNWIINLITIELAT